MDGKDIWSVKWTLPTERSVDGEKPFGINESKTLTMYRCQDLRLPDGPGGRQVWRVCP
jgi:hypothetical protein